MNVMRRLVLILLGVGLAGGFGCAKTKSGAPRASAPKDAASGAVKPSQGEPKVILSPLTAISGKVASVNLAGQFVILTFQAGALPVQDQKLAVYRGGLKVGEVKVSKEKMGQNLAADIVAGEARLGDEVRSD
jgi:hypothetical protein